MHCLGDEAGDDNKTSETDAMKLRYEQAAKERDEAQRAYTHARQEVDILLHSLHQMKAERDEAVTNYQNVVRAPAPGSVASGTGIIG